MPGVWANALGIILGSIVGFLFKKFISERVSKSIESALGVCTMVIAIKMALNFHSVIIMVSCVVIGGLIGTAIHLEDRINGLAQRLQDRFVSDKESKFGKGLAFTSILYCSGALAVIGSINAGLSHDYEVLYTKSMLDGFFSISMAAVYGIGVLFSAVPVVLYQGAITLSAGELKFLSHPHVIQDISGVGGVLVAMIGFNIMKIRSFPVGDYLPGMLLVMIAAPLWYLWL